MNLENIFTKYALTKPERLSLKELWLMTEANRAAFDYIGWSLQTYIHSLKPPPFFFFLKLLNVIFRVCRIVAKLEWLLLYFVAKDEQGFLSKEAVRGCFDGSLFTKISKMYKDSDRKSK